MNIEEATQLHFEQELEAGKTIDVLILAEKELIGARASALAAARHRVHAVSRLRRHPAARQSRQAASQNDQGDWFETVPASKEVAKGTLRSIVRRMSQATGVESDDLVKQLAPPSDKGDSDRVESPARTSPPCCPPPEATASRTPHPIG